MITVGHHVVAASVPSGPARSAFWALNTRPLTIHCRVYWNGCGRKRGERSIWNFDASVRFLLFNTEWRQLVRGAAA